jgi:isoleucyl-tRNA synthetase
MDLVRAFVSGALAVRKGHGLRVRQPLSALKVITERPSHLEPYAALFADEVNVKRVEFVDVHAPDAFGAGGRLHRYAVNARVAGPRLGKDVQRAIQACRDGDVVLRGQTVAAGGIELLPGEWEVNYDFSGLGEHLAGAEAGDGFVVLDTALTPELEAEGWARDVVRAVQDERKAAGLAVTDRIRLRLTVAPDRREAAQAHREMLARETLAADVVVEVGPAPPGAVAGVGVERVT